MSIRIFVRKGAPSSGLPVREWIGLCPDVITLRELWQTLRDKQALAEAASGTVRRWEDAVYLRACEFIRAQPDESLFVHNTLFTIFDVPQRKRLLEYALLEHKHALRTQQSATSV